MSNLSLFIPLTKVDVERRLVYGTITEEALDKAGEVMDYALSKPNFEKWSAGFEKATGGKSAGNLRVMHGDKVAGKFTKVVCDDETKAVEGCAKVVDDGEWNKVLEGCYTGFSVGGKYGKTVMDGTVRRYEALPSEVSLVDNPCVHGATFSVIKADGSSELRKFQKEQGAEEDKREPGDQGDPGDEDPELAKIETKARDLCKAAGFDPEEELTAATDEAVAVLKWHGFVEDARREIAEPGSVNLNPDVVQLQKWVTADGTQFDKRADAVAHDNMVKAAKVAAEISAPASEQMDKLDAALARIEGTEEEQTAFEKIDAAGRAHLAKMTGLADDALASFVNGAEPELIDVILGKADLSAAARKADAKDGSALPDGSFPIKTVDDLKNAVKAYGRAKDKTLAKEHIVARAKALKATDELPADWDGSTAKKGAAIGALRKGMYSVSRLASLLESLSWLRCDAKAEAEMEGDQSTVPAMLDENIARLGSTLIAMVSEEVQELATNGMDPADAEQMCELLACAHSVDDLAKHVDAAKHPEFAAVLAKAVADKDLQLEKRDGDGAPDMLSKAEGDALRKTVADLTDRLTKSVERIEALEKLPVAEKGFRRITKAQDTDDSIGVHGDGDATEQLAKVLAHVPEADRSMVLMKAAMRAGQVLAL